MTENVIDLWSNDVFLRAQERTTHKRSEAALVIILPVIRIERGRDDAGKVAFAARICRQQAKRDPG
jgi:hypothetical protein